MIGRRVWAPTVAVVLGLVAVLALAPALATSQAGSGSGPAAERPGPALCEDCVLEARGELEVFYLTVVEERRFARCRIGFRLHVGGSGSARVDGFTSTGTPCNDIDACFDEDKRALPWDARTRTTGPGRAVVDVDVCLDTCLGRFAGPAKIELTRVGRGRWRADGSSVPIGTSGWRFADGEWLLRERSAADFD